MWDEHYFDKAYFKRGWVVHQHALHMDHYKNHIQDDFHFIDECLRKFGVLEIASSKYDYYPDVIRQFHCTVFFDDDHNMTWMTCTEQSYGTYVDFCEALGFGEGSATGYKIHSEDPKAVSNISFCYPTSDCVGEPPAISGMYNSYNTLTKLFHENLVCKKGHTSDIRGYHINLLYWCKPRRQRKIDVCDFIFYELRRSVLTHMSPGYCSFVQKFIDSSVAPKFAHTGKRFKHKTFDIGLGDGWLEAPGLRHTGLGEEASFGSPVASSSHRAPPRQQSGAAKFFKNLWDMCKFTHDVPHRALVMYQDTRARQNEFFASKNYPFPPPSPEMNPVPLVNFEMPSIFDEMFLGYPISSGGPSRPTRTRTLIRKRFKEMKLKTKAMKTSHLLVCLVAFICHSTLFFSFLASRCQGGEVS
jgi:hypothetical protein